MNKGAPSGLRCLYVSRSVTDHQMCVRHWSPGDRAGDMIDTLSSRNLHSSGRDNGPKRKCIFIQIRILLNTRSQRRPSTELPSTWARTIWREGMCESYTWRIRTQAGEEMGKMGPHSGNHKLKNVLRCLSLYLCADRFELITLESINLKTLDFFFSKKFSLESSFFSGLAALLHTKAIFLCTNYS